MEISRISPSKGIDKNKKKEKEKEIIGESPDQELNVSPRWLIFEPTHNYSKPLRSSLTIDNLDEYPIAFCIRTKERQMPRMNMAYGILRERESISVDVIVPPSNDWIKNEESTIGRHHRIVFESLRIPSSVNIPLNGKERNELGKQIFRSTQQYCPFLRIYSKSNLILLPIKH